MAIFSKRNSKDEYWFVPNGATSNSEKAKEKKNAERTKAAVDSKNTIKATSTKKSSVSSSAKKTQNQKAQTTKNSATAVTAPATKTKKSASPSTLKRSTATEKTKSAANKVLNTKNTTKLPPKKKNSNIVTLTAANEIPKSIYYDEDEAEKVAKDINAENIELKGYGGTFEIKKSRDNRYVFNLYAANHLIIATSRIYSSAQSAQNGINSVMATAERANVEDQTLKKVTAVTFPKWEIYIDRGNQYRFRLHASNGICICHSQGYTTKASCKNGIDSIIRTVKNVKIDKSYLK